MNTQEILEFIHGDPKNPSGEQKELLRAIYRKGLVTRDVETCEYHLNDRGERFGKWLEGQKARSVSKSNKINITELSRISSKKVCLNSRTTKNT